MTTLEPRISAALLEHPLVYITRDIERAAGLSFDTPSYYTIANTSPLAISLAKDRPNILLLEAEEMASTRELLLRKETQKFIKKIPGSPRLLVFKNNGQMERTAKEHGWELLNPPASLASRVEEKISQIEWLGSSVSYLPEYRVEIVKNIAWKGTPFVLQFNHGHTGIGTVLINQKDDLSDIQARFPERPARCTAFIKGSILTNNNVVMAGQTLVGNISYQITGLAPFTDNAFTTIGNDWSLPPKLLSNGQKEVYKTMAEDIGKKLRESGWKGLFGIDAILEEETGKIFLIEINARQPASTTFESELQREEREKGAKGLTTFEAHLAALLDIDVGGDGPIPIESGAQIIQRVTRYRKKFDPLVQKRIAENGVIAIELHNTAIGKELMILRTRAGFMDDHNRLNSLGKSLV